MNPMAAAGYPSSIVLVICGPAGSGKTTLCDRLLKEFPDQIKRLVTTTSRPPRPGEQDGIDYHFLSAEAFRNMIREGAFIEWAKVHERFYGSQKQHMEELLRTGSDILLNIDIQGADSFYRESMRNKLLKGRLHRVFIKPKSLHQLVKRLHQRGSDDEREIERRLLTAEEELKVADSFEHVIISGSKDEDYAAIKALYLELKSSD